MDKWIQFLRDENGQAAIEYGLIAALISIAIISTLGQIGKNLSAVFYKISRTMDNAGQ